MDTTKSAKAEPKLGAARHPPIYMTLVFQASALYEHFLHKKCDFITIKSNDAKRFQRIDSVRKLIARHYQSYIIVRSPKNGIHFHVLASRDYPRPNIQLPRGVHYHVQTVYSQHTKKNRPPRAPSNDMSFEQEILLNKRVPPSVVSSVSSSSQLSSLIMYLYNNLMENGTYSRFENMAVRYAD